MPARPSSTVLSRSEAVRFLQRTTFGPRPADVQHLIDIGIDAWFYEQTSIGPEGSHLERSIDEIYLPNSLWGGYLGAPDQLRRRFSFALSQIFVVSRKELLPDNVAVFADILEANCFGTYRELLEKVTRSNAMGLYLTYAYNQKADPNRSIVPDENFAREVMQLFSVGLWELNLDGSRKLDSARQPIPAYDQDDILGLARVFTGFKPQENGGDRRKTARPMDSTGTFAQQQHERGEKKFLGSVIPAKNSRTLDQSLELALDIIAGHPNVAPFVCHQLIQRLVTSNPSAAYVRRVASVFNNDGSGTRGNLAAVCRAIVVDDEAWQSNPPASFGKLREPILRFTAIARALGIEVGPDESLLISQTNGLATELGQEPYDATSVFNFYRPGYVPPQSALGDRGLSAPEMQIANETTAIGWLNNVSHFLRHPPSTSRNGKWHDTKFSLGDLIALVVTKNLTSKQAGALVDELTTRLCPSGLDPKARSIIVRHLPTIRNDRYDANSDDYEVGNITRAIQLDRVIGATMMIAASSDFLHER